MRGRRRRRRRRGETLNWGHKRRRGAGMSVTGCPKHGPQKCRFALLLCRLYRYIINCELVIHPSDDQSAPQSPLFTIVSCPPSPSPSVALGSKQLVYRVSISYEGDDDDARWAQFFSQQETARPSNPKKKMILSEVQNRTEYERRSSLGRSPRKSLRYSQWICGVLLDDVAKAQRAQREEESGRGGGRRMMR